MPCRDEYPSEVLTRANDKIDKLNEIACDMGKVIRKYKLADKLPKRAHKWLREHERWDRKRIAQEKEERRRKQIKTAALEKLTSEEKEVLRLR